MVQALGRKLVQQLFPGNFDMEQQQNSTESATPKEVIRPVADNFSKFALGLAAAAFVLVLIILGYFLLVSRKTETPHSPAPRSEWRSSPAQPVC